MTIKPPTATIMRDHPRFEEFREIFLDHEPEIHEAISVPLQSCVPEIASAPGIESGEFYRIDIARMRPDQVKNMARFIQKRFGGKIEEIEAEISKQGFVPLRNEHCCVAIDLRLII
jgi:hypothetical protein